MTASGETMDGTVPAPPPLRRNRDFRLLWIGQTLSELGGAVAGFALPLVVLAVTGSAFAAGVVMTTRTVVTLVLRLPAGALVDRWNRRAVMVIADAGRALAAATVVVAAVADRLTFVQLL